MKTASKLLITLSSHSTHSNFQGVPFLLPAARVSSHTLSSTKHFRSYMSLSMLCYFSVQGGKLFKQFVP